MKTNQMIWNIGRYMCLAVLVALASCTRDEWIESVNTPQEEGLCFSLYADGDMKPAGTRSPEGDDLNENLISSVDIFMFKKDGTLNAGGYVHAESDEVVYLYKGSEWLNNFNEQDAPYTVYALANYKGDATLSGVQSLDDLKTVVAKDVDVVKWEGMGTNPAYEGKTFLMDGKKTVTYADLQRAQSDGEPYIVQMPLTRAAVKIELTLNFSDEWAQKFIATGLKAQLSNYASITPALSDGNPLDGDQRGLSNYPGLPGDEMKNFSVDPIFSKGDNDDYNGSKIRFYTYINRWDDFIDNETMLLIDLPGRYDENGKPASEDAELLDHNFYKVPIISNAEPQIFQRNTFYQITAEVNMKGTATVDVPVELIDVQFQTAPWTENNVNGGDVDADYLMLNKYYVDIRNVDSYDVEFYSSSPIEKVEIVGFENQNEAQAADIDFDYPGEGTEIPGVYFVNKYNQRRDVTSDGLVTVVDWDKDVVNGKIHLNSPNPDNVTKRYITLKVTNTDRLSKYVVVEQYPLEYIQPIPGYYSYRSDFISQLTVINTITCHYENEFYTSADLLPPNINFYTFRQDKGAESMEFQSKVVEDEKIMKYGFKSEEGTDDWKGYFIWKAVSDENSFSDEFNNNMMYSVAITQTDDRYKIAYPLRTTKFNKYCTGHLYDTAISSKENDQLISPNFTLASHLGYVTSTNKDENFWEFAELHCGEYVETYQDEEGNTVVYDNWRLPTSAEIEVILRYQNDPKTQEVMDEVLTEDYYYVCWDGAMGGQGIAQNPYGNGNGLKAVRCVRDLLPEEKFQYNQ